MDDANTIDDWVASLDDDTQMTKGEHATFDAVPLERCKALRVFVRGWSFPIHAACVPANGDRMRLYTKRAIRLGADGAKGPTLSMPVIEVTNPASPGFVRLYVHPVHGPILSTLNIEL